ncbi:MAG TPA: chemotaxis protein CheB, partial [Ramlibacter sp.]
MPVIAIGGSAGGIEALRVLVESLPADLDAAVLVVVHQPLRAHSGLQQVLQAVSLLPVSFAVDGERPRPGRIYVATPDRLLVLKVGMLDLTSAPRECHVRPAVNVLFRSVALALGRRAAGVVLSGTLDDGTAGLWAIKDHGGAAYVQDPDEALHP